MDGAVGQALLGDGGAALAVGNVLLATAPAAVCVVVLTALDQYVRRTLDRSLADSTVHAADGDEFTQVDARIEELLERVRTPGLLDEELGERARVLGDELRVALARSHDRTWLRIAVEESALLSSAVAVDDPGGAAALLPPLDRSRLLSVLWLLTVPAARPSLAVRLEAGAGGEVELTLVAAGIRARDLDRSVWGILSEIGEHRTTTDHGATRIRVAHRPRRRTTT
ncbi:hypothetical protein [Rathayibacter sp. AY2B7]|uniref:hypothetical protein n=1 Tax=Rathayibacter sp. AY2B7 TaxID=2080571 RepID=UPI0011B0DB03|nr:hypothetical protein [Rathayibacter sp. AY2B7]